MLQRDLQARIANFGGCSMDDCGYQEIPHTADWALQVWAPDLPGLLAVSARGMYDLSGVVFDRTRPLTREIVLDASDPEALLVAFLSELLYLAEIEGSAFDQFDLVIHARLLTAKLGGSALISQTKLIKAVTFHNLVIHQTERGLEATVVFDV
jgi:SHS2 domain-containing protein